MKTNQFLNASLLLFCCILVILPFYAQTDTYIADCVFSDDNPDIFAFTAHTQPSPSHYFSEKMEVLPDSDSWLTPVMQGCKLMLLLLQDIMPKQDSSIILPPLGIMAFVTMFPNSHSVINPDNLLDENIDDLDINQIPGIITCMEHPPSGTYSSGWGYDNPYSYSQYDSTSSLTWYNGDRDGGGWPPPRQPQHNYGFNCPHPACHYGFCIEKVKSLEAKVKSLEEQVAFLFHSQVTTYYSSNEKPSTQNEVVQDENIPLITRFQFTDGNNYLICEFMFVVVSSSAYDDIASWATEHPVGAFRIHNKDALIALWGGHKASTVHVSYANFARALRDHYYLRGTELMPIKGRLLYRFNIENQSVKDWIEKYKK